jgi:predicted ATP-dependent serine protease
VNRYIDFRDVELTPDEWILDRGRILKGEWNVLAGEGGMGKTTMLAAWIAELTRDGVKVLYLGERNPKGMLKRLLAAGADLEHVRTLNLSDFADIRSSVGAIAQAVEDGFELVILDPLSHFLPIEADSHNDAKLRAVARPLADLVQETGLTILGLVHLNKNEGSSAIHRLT